ncbi:MAG: enoyl-CoA hydratase-related protein, partial [Actinomycetota bacterium]
MSDVVTVEIDGTTAVVTLNRPEARNALNSEVLRAAPAEIARLDADETIEAIILTGADPAFCAGLDLKELGSTGANLGSSGANGRRPRRGPFAPRTTPLIGAVNGPAVTGGLEYALACDFLIASDRARFADTHARVGVMPGWGLTVLLPQAVGVRRARQMSVTGNYVDAET